MQVAAVRVGVAGCGYWGSKHVRILDSLSEVDKVVAIDPDEVARKALAASFPRITMYGDLETAIHHIDALVVATPAHLHAPIALAAISHGKHVLVEKPLTTSTSDAEQLLEEAERAGVVLMVGHTFEHNPAVWRLKEAIDSGELGEVYYIDTARLNLGLYQSDINVLWDLAPHDISILNYLLDSKPTAVDARGYSFANGYSEDVTYASLTYEDVGAEAHLHLSWLDPQKVRRITVVGSKKMAVYNDVATEEKLRIYDKGVAIPDSTDASVAPMSYRYGNIVSPYIDFREPLRIEDQHFIDCIRSGTKPSTDGANGLAVVQVLEAADRSMRERRVVRLDPGSNGS